MADNITDDQKVDLKEAFEMFDRDRDGWIGVKEVGNIMRSLGQDLNEVELSDLMKHVDCNEENQVDFNGFLQIMQKRAKDFDIEDELVEAFKIFDKDSEGKISTEEFRHIMLTLGERLTEDEVDEMIKEADPKGEGFIDYHEFSKIILSK
jgi:calmodulin